MDELRTGRAVLTEAQARAVAHVTARARSAWASTARDDDAVATVASELAAARVTLSFHPDRIARDGASVAQGLLRSGRYQSQFETGVTSGSPSAFPGGSRDRWEDLLFGGAYRDAAPAERPTYGVLDVLARADGGSPRFGSCFFVARPEVLARCTFTSGDSHLDPSHVGTRAALEPIAAELLGRRRARHDNDAEPLSRGLDDYIEAQIHGELRLGRDLVTLVVDPSFLSTPTGAELHALAAQHGVALEVHAGYSLDPSAIPDAFRGPHLPRLAARVMAFATPGRSVLDPAALGRAAQALDARPDADPAGAETWQHLKHLWHALAELGGLGPDRAQGRAGAGVRASR